MSVDADRPQGANDPADWIVAIAVSRDRGCIIALFTFFAPKVNAYLQRRGVSKQNAEELAQETLLAVWRNAGQFDPERATAGAWVYTIARNLLVDLFRRERHPDDGCIAEAAPEPVNPEQHLKTTEAEAQIRAAIDRLAPEQATVMRLSFFEERSHPQIASDLGVPLGTVKSRIRLATIHLRSDLERFD
jgi:RNA polymerase sigma-70 factor (ECF subfamily)